MIAPETLGLDTRVEIRKDAIRLLEEMPEGVGRLVIDLARTHHVDSAGLGALMLIQRRAAERRQLVVLRNTSDEIRFLLEEGVVESAADVDACLILGAGFPFFLGGLTKHLDQTGVAQRVIGRPLAEIHALGPLTE